MALKAQKMIIFPFIVCPECFLTNILRLVELNDVGKFKVARNDGHLEEIVRNGGSGSKEDEKDQNDHTSEGCAEGVRPLLQEIPFATAGRSSTVTHVRHPPWGPLRCQPLCQMAACAYTGRAHDGMSPGNKAVAKFTKTH